MRKPAKIRKFSLVNAAVLTQPQREDVRAALVERLNFRAMSLKEIPPQVLDKAVEGTFFQGVIRGKRSFALLGNGGECVIAIEQPEWASGDARLQFEAEVREALGFLLSELGPQDHQRTEDSFVILAQWVRDELPPLRFLDRVRHELRKFAGRIRDK